MKAANLRKWLISCILFLGILLISRAQNSTRFIKQVRQYQDSIKMDRKTYYKTIDPTTFNLNYYMHLYNKIHLDTKLEYDYVFFDNRLDGKPYIFVREHSFDLGKYLEQEASKALRTSSRTRIYKTEKPRIVHPKPFQFLNDSAIIEPAEEILEFNDEEYNGFIKHKLYRFLNDSINRAYNRVVPEDSEEGYIQYLFFREMGEQFALKWHESYNEKSVIANAIDIKQILIKYTNNSAFECNQKDLKKISKIDPTPCVKLDKDSCIITWYEIETHRGIFKRTYSISRSFPYCIQRLVNTCLLEINITFVY